MKTVYSDTGEEYQALRGGTGLVDYEGAGLYILAGPGAAGFLGRVSTRAVDFLLDGQISAALLLREDGTIVAETLVHGRGREYLVEVWPAQAQAAGEHLRAVAADDPDVTLTDVSDQHRLFGLEGPESFRIIQKFLDFPVASMAYRSFAQTTHGDDALLISRTGVTGEYGFKLWVPAAHEAELRTELIGLGAREVGTDAIDICRLETRFVNIERESGEAAVTPFDLGLQWMADFGGEFIGAAALRAAQETPGSRQPVCWQAGEGVTAVPAAGAPLELADGPVGEVTNAAYSPKLNRVIGTASVERAVAASGLEFALGSSTVRTISAPFLVASSFGISME
jgi:aminomethyltransferase